MLLIGLSKDEISKHGLLVQQAYPCAQLEYLICNKNLQTIDDIITNCGGDNSNGFVWIGLKLADFSYNQLQTVDTLLEFAQYL
uniref:Uncharacterized protein n=1 Tax=Glossina morsitans morsitans TaxID=37546 RepID=A0A1B0G2F5_GLOMM